MNPRTWVDIGSDVNWIDHGGLWAMRFGARRYFVIEFTNMREHGFEIEPYCVELSLVDIDNPQLHRALQSIGVPEDEITDLHRVYALSTYGAEARLLCSQGTSSKRLMRVARAEAFRLRQDPAALQDALSAPVNALGSTAAEYAVGDIQSGILRGVAAGDPNAELMLKLGVR